MKMLLLCLLLSSTASFAYPWNQESEALGMCYSDRHCTQPIVDGAVTVNDCVRAGRGWGFKLKRKYWISSSTDYHRYPVNKCNLVYDRIGAPPEPNYPRATCFPFGSGCNDALPCCQGTCQGAMIKSCQY